MVPKAFKETIIWRWQVQSWLQADNNTGIHNTCTQLWLTDSEQATPVDSIKDVVRSSVNVPEFDKHLNKAGGHIGRNVAEITIKMKTIVRKPLMIYMYIYISFNSFFQTNKYTFVSLRFKEYFNTNIYRIWILISRYFYGNIYLIWVVTLR